MTCISIIKHNILSTGNTNNTISIYKFINIGIEIVTITNVTLTQRTRNALMV